MTHISPALITEIEASYRKKRLYNFFIVGFILILLVAGLMSAEGANAGSFWVGLSKLFAYPADIIKEAWAEGWGFWSIPFTIRHENLGIKHTYFYFLIETINMALISTLIGFFIGAVFSIFASRNLVKSKLLVWIMRRITDIARAFPEIVIALFLIFIFGKNPIAAVIAIAFHTIGALSKLFSEVNENADMKALEGLEASGASWLQKIWYGLLPQVLPAWISYTLLRLEINVRASAIMGFVGAGGLGQQFKTFVDWKYGADIAAIMLLLIITIMLVDWFATWLRRKLIGNANLGTS